MWNVLIRCTISFADMTFGRGVVLHFPQEIQKNLAISEGAPQLLRALDAEMIDAVQFLKRGRVRVTCKTAEYRDDLLEGSINFTLWGRPDSGYRCRPEYPFCLRSRSSIRSPRRRCEVRVRAFWCCSLHESMFLS